MNYTAVSLLSLPDSMYTSFAPFDPSFPTVSFCASPQLSIPHSLISTSLIPAAQLLTCSPRANSCLPSPKGLPCPQGANHKVLPAELCKIRSQPAEWDGLWWHRVNSAVGTMAQEQLWTGVEQPVSLLYLQRPKHPSSLASC